MSKKIFLNIIGIVFFCFFHVAFSAGPVCTEPPELIDIDAVMWEMQVKAKANIIECIDAYTLSKEASITTFSCPSGSMFVDDFQGITSERMAYRIGVATMFQYIDENALAFARSLQCIRERDPIKWYNSTIQVLGGWSVQWYADRYREVCSLSRIQQLLIEPTYWAISKEKIITTTETFPYDCDTIANKKILALENLITLLQNKGIEKSFQNDKSQFMESVKTRYSGLVEKFSRYFRSMGQAVSKLDSYLRRTIQ